MGHANERAELGSGNLDTCRLLGTNPAFAIQSIDQLVIAELAVTREQTGRTRIRLCDKRASGHQRAETRLSFSNRALGLVPEAIRRQTVTFVPFFGTEFRDSRGPDFRAFRIRPETYRL